jgi:ParB family chromosome partitioning protein
MSRRRRGLGRGLGALIPGAEAPSGLVQVDVGDITVNPRQPRVRVDEEGLRELADSISEHGLLQPLIVTELHETPPEGGPRYQLVAGERRWRAAMLAGFDSVPVLVKEATPQETLELALVENLQRADLNPLEEASAYQQLVEEFGLTQEQVAERVGRSRVTVTNSLRLLRLPKGVKEALQVGRISEGHARALLGLDKEPIQLRVLREIVKRGISVRQTEELVRRLVAGAKQQPAPQQTPQTRALEDSFRRALGTKVNLYRTKRGGRLVIHFYSEEELQSIYELIVREGL